MNQDLSELLIDLFIGATFLDSGEVQGIHFTRYSDGDVLLNIRCATQHPSLPEEWHYILVPSAGIQCVQDRLASIPSVPLSSEDELL